MTSNRIISIDCSQSEFDRLDAYIKRHQPEGVTDVRVIIRNFIHAYANFKEDLLYDPQYVLDWGATGLIAAAKFDGQTTQISIPDVDYETWDGFKWRYPDTAKLLGAYVLVLNRRYAITEEVKRQTKLRDERMARLEARMEESKRQWQAELEAANSRDDVEAEHQVTLIGEHKVEVAHRQQAEREPKLETERQANPIAHFSDSSGNDLPAKVFLWTVGLLFLWFISAEACNFDNPVEVIQSIGSDPEPVATATSGEACVADPSGCFAMDMQLQDDWWEEQHRRDLEEKARQSDDQWD